MPGWVLTPLDATLASGEAFSPDSALVADVLPSPNHGERKRFLRADSIILHYTGMATAEAAIALLRDPAAEVSSHYVVEESGRIVQLVPEARRAWHAGVSCWRGERDMNSASIGVEICNRGHDGGSPPFADRQIEAVVALCRDVTARCLLRPERVLAHSDIAPARKRDPGEAFPWAALGRAGIGHWVEADPPDGVALIARGQQGPPVRGLQSLLALYGYDIDPSGVYDARTQTVVAAFQRHFRPAKVDGAADHSTVETLRRLLDGLS
ncbi:MAG TPA: N-acetylmuramoyl-L-alanine amidase [Roseiarcus sp.]|nr:N-acetylmuramoyl-L-alanine amidase [Roseiarcus sp.]